MSSLIVGIGSALRADDGVGEAVLEMLAQDPPSDTRLISADITGLDLLKHVLPGDTVIIVDALDAGLPPGEILFGPLDELVKPVAGPPVSPHVLGLAETLRLARSIGMENPFILAGVQARDFSWNEGLSPEVAESVPELRDRIIAFIKQK